MISLSMVVNCESVRQGVRVKSTRGTLVANSQRGKDMVFWADTSPPEIGIELPTVAEAEVRIWNCWQDDKGVIQAWIGNAGMLIEEGPASDGSEILLRCSAGFGMFEPDDMRVAIRWR